MHFAKKHIKYYLIAVGATVALVAGLGVAFPVTVTVTAHCVTQEEVPDVWFETPLYERMAEIQYVDNDPSTVRFSHSAVFWMGWQAHVGCGRLPGDVKEWRTNNRSDSSWRTHRDLVCDAPQRESDRTIYGRCTDK